MPYYIAGAGRHVPAPALLLQSAKFVAGGVNQCLLATAPRTPASSCLEDAQCCKASLLPGDEVEYTCTNVLQFFF